MKLRPRIQNPESRICQPWTYNFQLRIRHFFRFWTLDFQCWRIASFVVATWIFLPAVASAQMGSSGAWPIQVYGMVQVEPGSHVLTFAVKDEQIRFAVSDVRTSDRRFSMARFLSDTRPHTPSVYIRGSEALLDLLIKEKPSKRVLRLTGHYYVDTRAFVVSAIDPFREQVPKPPF
jgi:hypothetical protein